MKDGASNALVGGDGWGDGGRGYLGDGAMLDAFLDIQEEYEDVDLAWVYGETFT